MIPPDAKSCSEAMSNLREEVEQLTGMIKQIRDRIRPDSAVTVRLQPSAQLRREAFPSFIEELVRRGVPEELAKAYADALYRLHTVAVNVRYLESGEEFIREMRTYGIIATAVGRG